MLDQRFYPDRISKPVENDCIYTYIQIKNNLLLEFDNEHIVTMLGTALIKTHSYRV